MKTSSTMKPTVEDPVEYIGIAVDVQQATDTGTMPPAAAKLLATHLEAAKVN